VSDAALKEDLLRAVDRVLSHGQIVLGPEVEAFEAKIAWICGRRYAVGVSSGTDALYTALRALDIGPGDEVITTPLSWIATLNAIVLAGATPVFVDIGNDLNINADLINEAITPKTKAILPVHFTGKMCDMESIMEIARKKHLTVIEDAAQAFGARVKAKKAGAFGDVACFSMNAMKVLHSYGEAGAVLTDDKDIRERIVSLRYNGTVNREDCHYPSLNFRLQTIQAAMLLVELERIDRIIERRREIARYYDKALKCFVKCPKEENNSIHVYYTYTVMTEKRDEFRAFLQEKGIETKIHHPILMPYHTAYKGRYAPHIPVADKLIKEIVSIPNHEKMTDAEVEYVVSSIREFYGVSS
jgi:dTDP-4-amino-4,6-dideoxygalactose transaminase